MKSLESTRNNIKDLGLTIVSKLSKKYFNNIYLLDLYHDIRFQISNYYYNILVLHF